jgi:SAM-dependent methyltransferase
LTGLQFSRMNTDPTRRFSDRVADYVRYRPRYPAAVLELLRKELGLRTEHAVVDVGSGTGFLTELFLAAGHRVWGVEPNAEMRAAGEQYLSDRGNFTSVNGSAEVTTLDAQCADLVVAGQAFHWFRPAETRREFQRILRPGGWVALIWNDRTTDEAGVFAAYEKLVQDFRTDNSAEAHRVVLRAEQGPLVQFFAPQLCQRRVMAGLAQEFDFEGLAGRLLSSSYAPKKGQPRHEAMLAELRQIFDRFQSGGRVRFEHSTEIVFGRLDD